MATDVQSASPPGTGGTHPTKCRTKSAGRLHLTVAGRGDGLPAAFTWKEDTSLGRRLGRLLTEQLQGTLNLETVGGVRASVTFRWPPG